MRVTQSARQVASHGFRPTKFRSASAAVLAATLSAGVLLVNGPHVGVASAASPTWQSGVYVGGCNTTAINQFKTWRNAPSERGMVFLGATWSAIQNPTSAASCFKSIGVPVTFSVPMIPSSGASISSGAGGSYDAYWKKLGQNLVSAGQANADLRIGWEMNGGWFNWSAKSNPTAWKNYWIHIVKAMRTASGQHFTFDWSPGNGQSFAVENAYPGDAYVDYIGQSLYDEDYSSKSQTVRWNALLNGSHGLAWQASFAAAHGKKLAYPEWALATPSSFSGHGGGDDSYFVQQFYNFLKSHNVAYETYFDSDHSPNVHKLNSGTSTSGNFKNAGATYRSLFGGAAGNVPGSGTSTSTATPPKSSTPAPTVPSSTAKDTLLYSTSATRSSPHPLNAATVTGSAAVWITPSGSASKVTFSLDGKSIRTESSVPYDFGGTAVSGAKLYSFSGLAKGKHTVIAVIALSTGSKTVTATFTR
jgi:Glycosyl hydrolase family 26